MEYFEPPTCPNPIRATLSFRRRLDSLCDAWLLQFLRICNDWLDSRKYVVVHRTTGIHENASYIHVHYHVVVWCSKVLSNPMSSFKYDILNKRFPWGTRKQDEPEFHFETLSDVIGENRYTSIQMKEPKTESDVVKFLQYPYKEANDRTLALIATKNATVNLLKDYCIDTLVEQANASYKSAVAIRTKKEEIEKKKETEWDILCDICDQSSTLSFPLMVHNVLRHYKQNVERPPHPKTIIHRCEVYAFKKGIISIEEFATVYSQLIGHMSNDEKY